MRDMEVDLIEKFYTKTSVKVQEIIMHFRDSEQETVKKYEHEMFKNYIEMLKKHQNKIHNLKC